MNEQAPRGLPGARGNDKDRLLSLSEHLPIFLREPRFRRLRPCWPTGECTTTPNFTSTDSIDAVFFAAGQLRLPDPACEVSYSGTSFGLSS